MANWNHFKDNTYTTVPQAYADWCRQHLSGKEPFNRLVLGEQILVALKNIVQNQT